jgi:hypothetical protein
MLLHNHPLLGTPSATAPPAPFDDVAASPADRSRPAADKEHPRGEAEVGSLGHYIVSPPDPERFHIV